MIRQPCSSRFRDWRTYEAGKLDEQYDQRNLVPDADDYGMSERARSAKARARLKFVADLRYGPTRHEVLDVYPARTPGGPTVLFFHGGAWRSGSKDDEAFAAPAFHEAGATFVPVNFAPVPEVMLEQQVHQARTATAWIRRNAVDLGVDPAQLFVAGHSSGGHLAAMVLATAWEAGFDLPADTVKGGLITSGIFDLEPVRHTRRNRYLRLTAQAARELSPLANIPAADVDLVEAYGTRETSEFQRQSHAYAEALTQAARQATLFELENLNHYEVGAEYGRPEGPVIAMLRLVFR